MQAISQMATGNEVLLLNEACCRERIDFTFASPTYVVSLLLVQNLTKAVGGALVIVERPAVNPFGHARGTAALQPGQLPLQVGGAEQTYMGGWGKSR